MEQQTNVLTEVAQGISATELTLFGMGFVFIFLTVLVLITTVMSTVIQKINQKDHNRDDSDGDLSLKDELDEETKFVIEQAIKMHRGA